MTNIEVTKILAQLSLKAKSPDDFLLPVQVAVICECCNKLFHVQRTFFIEVCLKAKGHGKWKCANCLTDMHKIMEQYVEEMALIDPDDFTEPCQFCNTVVHQKDLVQLKHWKLCPACYGNLKEHRYMGD